MLKKLKKKMNQKTVPFIFLLLFHFFSFNLSKEIIGLTPSDICQDVDEITKYFPKEMCYRDCSTCINGGGVYCWSTKFKYSITFDDINYSGVYKDNLCWSGGLFGFTNETKSLDSTKLKISYEVECNDVWKLPEYRQCIFPGYVLILIFSTLILFLLIIFVFIIVTFRKIITRRKRNNLSLN
jgi:hypothetical protein